MRRRRAILVLAAVGAATAAAIGSGGAAAGSLDVRSTSIGVSEREFTISPYRRTVPPGRLKFNVKNFGEDVHDLVVVSPKGRRLGGTGEIAAGNQGVLRLKLNSPGVYRLICTQADHAARGMKSRVTVRRSRK